MKNQYVALLGILCGLLFVGQNARGTTNGPSGLQSVVANTNAAAKARWTSYYVSTNEYSKYLHEDFSYKSEVKLPKELDQKVQSFFKSDYRNTYTALKLSTEDEDQIYDIIDHAYHRQELFSTFHEYMDMLTELERMGSYIMIHDVDFKRIVVKGYENNTLTVEAIWTVHGTLHHITHNHDQKNANCVQFKVEVSPENELKIKSVNVVSIDRFNLYQ